MSHIGRSSVDTLRSDTVARDATAAVSPARLAAYLQTLAHLPAAQQRACRARLQHGQSYARIASELGETAAEARRTVSQAVEALSRAVFGAGGPASERLADLMGPDGDGEHGQAHDDTASYRTPADMDEEEEAVLRELFALAGAEPLPTTWGKFTGLQPIGSGGFGTVYSAVDPVLQTRVALKLYHAHRSQRPTDELLGEARKLARVHHPSVVVVHGADDINGRVGVWMELVQGETLEDQVHRGPNLGADAAVDVGIALCEALEAVHGAGIVHGDIKAQNVVCDKTGRTVLMDFGAARFTDPATAESDGNRAGTPAYMAPELFRSRGDRLAEPTVQSDVYALGVLLFYLVTGTHPVRGQSLEEIASAHGHFDQMLLLADEQPDLPDRFVAVVERALARTPDQRWLTAAEMRQALMASRSTTASRLTWQNIGRASGWAATVAMAVGALGWVAVRGFDLQIGIGPEFPRSPLDYFRFGGQAALPVVVTWVLAGAGLGLVVAIGALLRSRLAPVRTRWVDRARALDARLAATVTLVVALGCWGAIAWTFADIFGAVDALRTGGPAGVADPSVLGPAWRVRHQLLATSSELLSLALLFAAFRWFPRWETRVADAPIVRLMKWATVAVAFASLATAAVPRRVVWDRFEVVTFQDRTMFVVASSESHRLLYDPQSPDGSRAIVRGDAPELEYTGRRRKLFAADPEAE